MKSRRRRGRKKPMKLVQWFLALSWPKKVWLIAGVLIFCLMLAMIIYVAVVFNKLDRQEIKQEEIVINDLDEDVGVGFTNFVLFGGDSRKGDVDRDLNTDTIIIVSLNNETKEIKLVSVYRDTLLDLSKGSINKCNGAYNRGGAKQAINMLNMNLDLEIQQYVTVDFGAVSELVDMLGGVEVDVTEAERKEMNKFIWETATSAGKPAVFVEKSGVQVLDGVQATTYARIRKNVGNDFARTERQRLIIQKVAEKAMKSDLSTINKIVNELFPRISTNFTLTEVLSYAKSFSKYKITETTGFPFDKGTGTIPKKGSCVYPVTLKTNVTKLHQFLYGTEDYEPSSKVVSISAEIAEIVGNRKADPVDNTGNGNTGNSGNTGTGGNTGNEGGTGTPGSGTETPGSGTGTPGEGTETPGEGTDTPGSGTETPGGGTENPGSGTETPGGGDENPGTGTETPGGGTNTPGSGSETDGEGSNQS